MISLTVNGKLRNIQQPTNILDFLRENNIQPGFIVIEYNSEILRREDFGKVTLNDGDRLEIVQMVGGG